jgi:hypothetical protein
VKEGLQQLEALLPDIVDLNRFGLAGVILRRTSAPRKPPPASPRSRRGGIALI